MIPQGHVIVPEGTYLMLWSFFLQHYRAPQTQPAPDNPSAEVGGPIHVPPVEVGGIQPLDKGEATAKPGYTPAPEGLDEEAQRQAWIKSQPQE